MPKRPLEHTFKFFCAIVLGVTAIAKIISVLTHPKLADKKDIVFNFLSVKQVLSTTAILELAVAWICLIKSVSPLRKWGLLFWLGTCFALYRIGPLIILQKAQIECKC